MPAPRLRPRPRLRAPGAAPTLRAIVLTTASLASLAALTACGGPASEPARGADRQVASLPPSTDRPPGQGAPSDRAAGDSGRPQLRLDDSPERRNRLIAAWDKCLLEHGAKTGGTGAAPPPGAEPGGEEPVFVADPIPERAKNACADKLPIGPPEQDPALNPHYREDWQKDVSCLRSNGIMVHLTRDTSLNPNGLGWTYDDDYVDTRQDTSSIEQDCERKAFGGGE
ncbi:hypothetical protein [Actinacidiphila sp. bgisy167]|uniref:hypothetical protein n=1 Tax=Actinacidiphila sp. bgisy167 TaxID=3413797 RepID=UPI003D760E36